MDNASFKKGIAALEAENTKKWWIDKRPGMGMRRRVLWTLLLLAALGPKHTSCQYCVLPRSAAMMPCDTIPASCQNRTHGYTDVYSRHDYGWWNDTSTAEVAGWSWTRMIIVHNPAIRRCALNAEEPMVFEYGGEDIPKNCTRGVKLRGANGPSMSPGRARGHAVGTQPKESNESKPVIVALIARYQDGNHFHYGTLNPTAQALQLCADSAAIVGTTLDAVQCYPVSTVNMLDRSGTQATKESEWAQLLSFQRLVFGRAFLDDCGILEGMQVLAVVWGETPHPLYNFPLGSSRLVARLAKLPQSHRSYVSEEDGKKMVRCGQIEEGDWDYQKTHNCSVNKWVGSHGYSTDLMKTADVMRAAAKLRARVVGPEVPTPVNRRVVLFQRSDCAFPARMAAWSANSSLYKDRHKRRCLTNIDEIEDAIKMSGFNTTVVDMAGEEYADYSRVVKMLQRHSIFVGVEGSGSLHSMWLPKSGGGLLQITPGRSFQFGAIDLYTEAWMHYQGICVHNLYGVGDIHQTPLRPTMIAAAVTHLHERLVNQTCQACQVSMKTGRCQNTQVFS
ncbi:MAG: hypothetical protein CL678_15235 [Bdellovibrionaceae bacterium]|nr:hypothetical protein [Pseudobdellovibrionaceae bacterium]|tara:strand:- start:801 stop:2483 length:1683 start_codon:yes stop_codon:yes gene_type:complete